MCPTCKQIITKIIDKMCHQRFHVKYVTTNYKAVECDNCELLFHITFNRANTQTYKYLPKESCSWYCISSSSKIFPFSNLNEDNFHKTVHGKKLKFLTIKKN